MATVGNVLTPVAAPSATPARYCHAMEHAWIDAMLASIAKLQFVSRAIPTALLVKNQLRLAEAVVLEIC